LKRPRGRIDLVGRARHRAAHDLGQLGAVRIGRSARCSTIRRAIRRLKRSSPFLNRIKSASSRSGRRSHKLDADSPSAGVEAESSGPTGVEAEAPLGVGQLIAR